MMPRPRLGIRRGVRRTMRRLGGQRFVLLYHRVAEPAHDPFALAVSPARFAGQVEALRRHAPVMTVGAMMRALGDGTLPRRAVAISFDDGYADNLSAALPILERHDVPATVYLSAGLLDGRTPFWWDVLARILLGPHKLPSTLGLRLGRRTLRLGLGDDGAAEAGSARSRWRAWEDPPTARHAAYLALWREIRLLPPDGQDRVIADLRDWAGDAGHDPEADRPLDRAEAARLAASPLVEAGAHTLTHPVLPAHDPSRQRREIAESRRLCEEITGRPVGTFSYPYGDHDGTTARIVREAGFDSACTTKPGFLGRSADPFRLPRIHADDWDGEELERRLASAELC